MAQQTMVRENDLDGLLDYNDLDDDVFELANMTDDIVITSMESDTD